MLELQATLSSWTPCSDWALPMGTWMGLAVSEFRWGWLPTSRIKLLEFPLPAMEGATLPSVINLESSWYSGLLSATGVHGSFRVSWASEHLYCFVGLHHYPYTTLNNILLEFHVCVLPQGYKLLIEQAVNKYVQYIIDKTSHIKFTYKILCIFKKRNIYF